MVMKGKIIMTCGVIRTINELTIIPNTITFLVKVLLEKLGVTITIKYKNKFNLGDSYNQA